MGAMEQMPDLETQLLDRLAVEQQMAALLRRYRPNAGKAVVQHADAHIDGDHLQIDLDGQPVAFTRTAAVELAWAICVQMDILRSRPLGPLGSVDPAITASGSEREPS